MWINAEGIQRLFKHNSSQSRYSLCTWCPRGLGICPCLPIHQHLEPGEGEPGLPYKAVQRLIMGLLWDSVGYPCVGHLIDAHVGPVLEL